MACISATVLATMVVWSPQRATVIFATFFVVIVSMIAGAPSVHAICGNGTVDPGEQCDDGNSVSDDGCSSTCTIEAGWTCTNSPQEAPSVCCTRIPFPHDITFGPDGKLWFTEIDDNKIGTMTTSGKVTEYTIPTLVSNPRDITAGPDGNLWFTEYGGNKIGKITTAGVITEYALPFGPGGPRDITAGPDGNLWFTNEIGKIGKITTAGVITEYDVPSAGTFPAGITTFDGNLWFTEISGNMIGKSTILGSITEYPGAGNPEGITGGPDGKLWWTETTGNKIGRTLPNGNQDAEFAIPTGNSTPRGITASGADLWFAEEDGNKIGKITTGGEITEYAVPTGASDPIGITASGGNVWFAENLGHKIGKLTAGTITEYERCSQKSSGAPDMAESTDSGISSTDNITNFSTPKFSVSCTTGWTVTLWRGSTQIASGTCAGSIVALTPSTALVNGTFSITARQGFSADSSALSVTIDTVAPSTLAATNMTAATDSGSSSTDNITSDSTPDFDGPCVTDDVIKLYAGATQVASMTCASSAYSFTSSSLSDASYSMTVTATDTAGNVSIASSALTATIDTAAPTNTGTPDMTAATDSGSSSTDNNTSDTTPNFTVSCTTGTTVQLYDDGSSSGSSGTCSLSTVELTAGTLAEGSNAITAKETDTAGNVSAASSALTATIDTAAPTVSLLSPADNATGVGLSDNLILTFNENVVAASNKNIVLKKSSDASTVETIAASDTTKATVSSTQVTINPSTTLSNATDYYVTMDSGAFTDTAGNTAAGISLSTTWNFTTIAIVCGNSSTDSGEQCDDGNTTNGDCCSSTCQYESSSTVCRAAAGDCDIAEYCPGSSATCPSDVVRPVTTVCRITTGGICGKADICDGTSTSCADSHLPADTKVTGGLCCTGTSATATNPTCQGGCGDGKPNTGEECDDGNTINNDKCTNLCALARCGDGITQPASEACDDGNTVDDDTCRNNCTIKIKPPPPPPPPHSSSSSSTSSSYIFSSSASSSSRNCIPVAHSPPKKDDGNLFTTVIDTVLTVLGTTPNPSITWDCEPRPRCCSLDRQAYGTVLDITGTMPNMTVVRRDALPPGVTHGQVRWGLTIPECSARGGVSTVGDTENTWDCSPRRVRCCSPKGCAYGEDRDGAVVREDTLQLSGVSAGDVTWGLLADHCGALNAIGDTAADKSTCDAAVETIPVKSNGKIFLERFVCLFTSAPGFCTTTGGRTVEINAGVGLPVSGCD